MRKNNKLRNKSYKYRLQIYNNRIKNSKERYYRCYSMNLLFIKSKILKIMIKIISKRKGLYNKRSKIISKVSLDSILTAKN